MNTSVKDENGNIYYIAGKLGSGGQGCVFTVRDNDSVVIKALVNDDEKLDIIQDDTKYLAYQQNVRRIMAVGEFENIAVPYVMLEKPYCGYVMLFMNGLQSIDKLMLPYLYKDKNTGKIYLNNLDKSDKVTAKTKEEFYFAYNYNGGLVKRIKCLAKLAKIMGNFEDKDVVYCDISPNNVYISKNPESYETWLIDLDNLAHSSDVRGPIGTHGYMAPEVFKGNPNTIYSDRYSFALVAYRFLMIKEPFLGKAKDDFDSWETDGSDEDAFDEAVENGEISWIWEKDDDSNRSNTGLNPYEFLNDDLIQLFERTFNFDGRNNPKHRPSMWEWYDTLIKASESAFYSKLKFSDDSFSELVSSENNKKYYYQKVGFISLMEPFQKGVEIKRYIINIKNVVELSDEEGNVEYIAEKDKVIYWDSSKEVSKYYLSNFDIMNKRPEKYISDFITLVKQEKLFSISNEYNILCQGKDYDVIAIEDNCMVKTISDLLKTTIYVKYKGQIIKKITIEKE